ncbi:hypothetical protein AB0N17_38975 [Streptomyces sp. NPDC051133]|uniref:hypothetical protein n=1 Tax=Streptomyces sp. NPDC051133 TaxID=3155521 RepID=UPI0034409E44
MKPFNRRRFARLFCPAAVSASIVMALGAPPVQAAGSLTTLDNAMLGKIVGFGRSSTGSRAFTNQDYWNYCKKAGFGTGWGQCATSAFVEEQRIQEDQNYNQHILHKPNCGPDPETWTDIKNYTHSTTYSVGTSIGTGFSIEFDQAPLGVGITENVTFQIEASFSATWTHDVTYSNGVGLTIPGDSWGDIYFYTYHGQSHGLGSIEIVGGPRQDIYQPSTSIPYPAPSATVSIPMDVSGDLPKPLDPSMAALQTLTGWKTMTPAMSADDKRNICHEA